MARTSLGPMGTYFSTLVTPLTTEWTTVCKDITPSLLPMAACFVCVGGGDGSVLEAAGQLNSGGCCDLRWKHR